jgi:hypothetical protein
MYHGTIESRANRAWKYGLDPMHNKNYAWAQKCIYLTTNPSTAKYFGASGNYPPEDKSGKSKRAMPFGIGGREDVIVITISTQGLDPKKFKVDSRVKDSLIYFGSIPAKNIIDWDKMESIDEISREDFAKSLNKVKQMSTIQARMTTRIKDRIKNSLIRKDHINRGKCIHDENDAYEYPNKMKSLICKHCIETRYEPKRSKAILAGKCPKCMTYGLYVIKRYNNRISVLCQICNERRAGKRR